MQIDTQHLRSLFTRQLNVTCHELSIQEVYHHIALNVDAISAISVIKHRKFHAFYVSNKRHLLRSNCLIDISADVRNA